MAEISQIVNVSLAQGGASISPDNQNNVMLITSESDVLNSNKRVGIYSKSEYNANSKTVAHANTVLSQSPNPTNAGGKLYIGYWRANEETVAASSGSLLGGQLQEVVIVNALRSIADGAMKISIDSVEQVLTSIDFRGISTLDDVVDILTPLITDATVSLVNSKISIVSATTGATSLVSFASNNDAGSSIVESLQLVSGSGAMVVAGADESTLTAETKVEALDKLILLAGFKGFVFVDKVLDNEVSAIATWCGANRVLSYDVFSEDSNLEKEITNPVWSVTSSSQEYYRCLFHTNADKKFASAYMARCHVVDFTGTNTALTMQLKSLSGVEIDSVTSADATRMEKADKVGLSVYVAFKDSGSVVESGANNFVDNVYNKTALLDEVMTATFNVLKTTPTKIAQTVSGQVQLENAVLEVMNAFSSAGVIAAGSFRGQPIGDVDIFNDAMLAKGFFITSGSLVEQSTADRESRKAPSIEVAFNNAGAFHTASVALTIGV